jgi:hypothetical protein
MSSHLAPDRNYKLDAGQQQKIIDGVKAMRQECGDVPNVLVGDYSRDQTHDPAMENILTQLGLRDTFAGKIDDPRTRHGSWDGGHHRDVGPGDKNYNTDTHLDDGESISGNIACDGVTVEDSPYYRDPANDNNPWYTSGHYGVLGHYHFA